MSHLIKSTRAGRGFLVAVVAVLAARVSVADDLAAARVAIEQGRFAEASKLLKERGATLEKPVIDEASQLLDIMLRIRLDFPYTPEQMLERLKQSMPDATTADMEAWTKTGLLQHRVIDGQTWYFNVEPANLFRVSPEAKSRRKTEPPPAHKEFSIAEHVTRLVASAATSLSGRVCPVRQHIRYEIRIKDGNARLKPGAKVRCWLPFPQEYQQQRDVRLIATEPPGGQIAPNGTPQRTVYFEQTIDDPAKPPKFAVEFEYVTSGVARKLDPALVAPYDTNSPLYREFTAGRPPHIVFTPEVRQLAQEIAGDEPNPLEKARRIFRWVSKNIPWVAEMEYSTIPCLGGKGIAARKGDCGVQGLAFITLCRAAGVPARWQSGFQTLPGQWNLHDWSEIYIEPWGWLPADASYGVQNSPDPAVRDFYCGGIDPFRMIVNLNYGRELVPPKTSFRSEPNDFQRGEIEIDGVNLYYNEWDWKFDVQTTPLEPGFAWMEEAFDAVVPAALKAAKVPGAVISVGRLAPTVNATRRLAPGRGGGESARTSPQALAGAARSDSASEAAGSPHPRRRYETWTKAYGYMQTLPSKQTMPPDAIFDMASLTKPIATGTAMMQLIEQGQVKLDDAVAKYLPEFDTDAKRGVTIRHLMTHMSGLPSYLTEKQRERIRTRALELSMEMCSLQAIAAALLEETRSAIRGLELTSEPGKTVVYSCLNAILCAEIIESVTKTPLDTFAEERIFAPLKMTDTAFRPPREAVERIASTARCGPPHSVMMRSSALDGAADPGQQEADEFLRGIVHDPLAAMQNGVSGNAGLFSTAADLSRFAQMLIDGGQLDGVRILREETVEQMTRVQNAGGVNSKGQKAERGLFWEIYPAATFDGVATPAGFGHTGYTGVALRVYPEAGYYIILLTNRVHPDDKADVDPLRRAVWRMGAAVLNASEPSSP